MIRYSSVLCVGGFDELHLEGRHIEGFLLGMASKLSPGAREVRYPWSASIAVVNAMVARTVRVAIMVGD
ncbi:hypothetical protein [Nonomuraea sp. NPDC003727]